MEEDWSSANHFKIFWRQKEALCVYPASVKNTSPPLAASFISDFGCIGSFRIKIAAYWILKNQKKKKKKISALSDCMVWFTVNVTKSTSRCRALCSISCVSVVSMRAMIFTASHVTDWWSGASGHVTLFHILRVYCSIDHGGNFLRFAVA